MNSPGRAESYFTCSTYYNTALNDFLFLGGAAVSEVAMESSPGPSTSTCSRTDSDVRPPSSASSAPRAGKPPPPFSVAHVSWLRVSP